MLKFNNRVLNYNTRWLANKEAVVPPRTDGYYLKVISSGTSPGCIYDLSPNATALESHIINNNTSEYLTLEQVNSSSRPSGVYIYEDGLPTYAYLGSNATNVTFKYTAAISDTVVTYSLIHSVNGVETVCMSQTVSSYMYNETMTLYYNPHNITYSTLSNGSVSGPAIAGTGTTVTVTATPNVNYKLDYITVDGSSIQGNTFTMPDHDVVIGAVFAEKTGSDYRLELRNYNGLITNMNPYASAAYSYTEWQGRQDISSTDLANLNGSTGYNVSSGGGSFSIVFTDITATSLTFKQGGMGNYTLYKTVNGVESQIGSGDIPGPWISTTVTISLT